MTRRLITGMGLALLSGLIMSSLFEPPVTYIISGICGGLLGLYSKQVDTFIFGDDDED